MVSAVSRVMPLGTACSLHSQGGLALEAAWHQQEGAGWFCRQHLLPRLLPSVQNGCQVSAKSLSAEG